MTQEHPFSRMARLVYDSTGEGARALHRAAKAIMAPKPPFSCPQVSARRVKPSRPASDSQESAPLTASRSARIACSVPARLTSPPCTLHPPPPPAASPSPPSWPSPPASASALLPLLLLLRVRVVPRFLLLRKPPFISKFDILQPWRIIL